ncbi:type II secretion system protein [bacterium]|nr:type II secretion system protein [bacterium]
MGKKAFTLAEVLITLGIIGVVAALTIPTLMQKTEERETVSKLKKVYSTLQNAYSRAINDEGELSDWGTITDTAASSDLVLQKFVPYLNVLKNCGTTDFSCFYTGTYSTFKGSSFSGSNAQYNIIGTISEVSRILLSDGTSVAFDVWNGQAFVGVFIVDINGKKKPNSIGRDTFIFEVFNNGKILPAGYPNDPSTSKFTCSYDDTSVRNGQGCAAWVLQYENMDYMHCAGLSWTGKTKCD